MHMNCVMHFIESISLKLSMMFALRHFSLEIDRARMCCISITVAYVKLDSEKQRKPIE